ncbi:alpha/beta fold hydrolase [Paenibacillus albidus]|uniref:alpha/beta fold hydrolase n=1 Tax=Paenibacillus albidus TaxID=2041023 RepID=UPI001BECD27C|nr:alpha/beta hydrolase [Paenibacillus albidus]MBT2289950.1 alpha/beta fold hydrolase [Paenibacillus albidus]
MPGTFSGADVLLPLARELGHARIWLADLPGMGRTPYHHQGNTLAGHVQALVDAITALNTPVTLIGHSYGALLAAKVMERIPDRIHSLELLQPVFHPAPSKWKYPYITKKLLSRITAKSLKAALVAESCFDTEADIPPEYVQYVLGELRSPRVRTTLAGVLAQLTRSESFELNPEQWDAGKVRMIWGTHDTNYEIPERYRHLPIERLPYGHHFPLSHPQETALLLQAHTESGRLLSL